MVRAVCLFFCSLFGLPPNSAVSLIPKERRSLSPCWFSDWDFDLQLLQAVSSIKLFFFGLFLPNYCMPVSFLSFSFFFACRDAGDHFCILNRLVRAFFLLALKILFFWCCEATKSGVVSDSYLSFPESVAELRWVRSFFASATWTSWDEREGRQEKGQARGEERWVGGFFFCRNASGVFFFWIFFSERKPKKRMILLETGACRTDEENESVHGTSPPVFLSFWEVVNFCSKSRNRGINLL